MTKKPMIEFRAPGASAPPPVGRELTTADAVKCADLIESLAMTTFLARTRVVETTIREYLIEHHKGSPTPRQEFDEAVRHILAARSVIV